MKNTIIDNSVVNVNNVVSLCKYLTEIKSPKFVLLNHYKSKGSGELSNYLINCNVSYLNAKKRDLFKLKKLKPNDIIIISKNNNISIDIVELAINEMIVSFEHNIDQNKDNHSNQSKAQTDNYINISPSLKINKNTNELYVFGQIIYKDRIKVGEKKEVIHNEKTLAKNAINKYLDLRSSKFRSFIINRIENAHVKYQSLNIIAR